MSNFLNNLKLWAQEHPMETILITIAAATAIAKIIDASGHAVGSAAYARQINAKLR